jgi:hypothetical protein
MENIIKISISSKQKHTNYFKIKKKLYETWFQISREEHDDDNMK